MHQKSAKSAPAGGVRYRVVWHDSFCSVGLGPAKSAKAECWPSWRPEAIGQGPSPRPAPGSQRPSRPGGTLATLATGKPSGRIEAKAHAHAHAWKPQPKPNA